MTEAQFMSIVYKYRPGMLKRAKYHGISPTDAEDVVASAVLYAWKKSLPRGLDPDETKVRNLLFWLTHKRAEHWSRADARRNEAMEYASELELARDRDRARIERVQEAVQDALKQLPDQDAYIAWNVLALDATITEVARELEMRPDTVVKRLDRSIKPKLRELLEYLVRKPGQTKIRVPLKV